MAGRWDRSCQTGEKLLAVTNLASDILIVAPGLEYKGVIDSRADHNLCSCLLQVIQLAKEAWQVVLQKIMQSAHYCVDTMLHHVDFWQAETLPGNNTGATPSVF